MDPGRRRRISRIKKQQRRVCFVCFFIGLTVPFFLRLGSENVTRHSLAFCIWCMHSLSGAGVFEFGVLRRVRKKIGFCPSSSGMTIIWWCLKFIFNFSWRCICTFIKFSHCIILIYNHIFYPTCCVMESLCRRKIRLIESNARIWPQNCIWIKRRAQFATATRLYCSFQFLLLWALLFKGTVAWDGFLIIQT